MDNSEVVRSILGLSEVENTVFKLLSSRGRLKVSEITTISKLPRSTVTDILQRLRSRGLVRPTQIKKHTEWKITNNIKLAEKFLNAAEALQVIGVSDNAPKNTYIKLSRQTEFVAYIGWRNMIKIYESEVVAHKGQRLYIVQSVASAQAALDIAGPQSFVQVNEAIKQNNIIVEAIVSSSMIELYKKQSAEWLNSMQGRMTAMRVVSDDLLDFSAELIIFQDKFFLANWEEEVLIVLKNQDILAMILKLYRLFYETGSFMNQNENLTKILYTKS